VDALGDDDDDDGIKTESISSTSSLEEVLEEEEEEGRVIEGEKTGRDTGNLGLDMRTLRRVATSTSKKVAEKTKEVAEKTKEKSEILTARTAVSARALKTSVGHVTKNVVNKVKGDT